MTRSLYLVHKGKGDDISIGQSKTIGERKTDNTIMTLMIQAIPVVVLPSFRDLSRYEQMQISRLKFKIFCSKKVL